MVMMIIFWLPGIMAESGCRRRGVWGRAHTTEGAQLVTGEYLIQTETVGVLLEILLKETWR